MNAWRSQSGAMHQERQRHHAGEKKPEQPPCMARQWFGYGQAGRHEASADTRGSALLRALAWVLFATGMRAALQAALLAAAAGLGGVAIRWNGLGGADVGFDSDFFRHEGLRIKKGAERGILIHAAINPQIWQGMAHSHRAKPQQQLQQTEPASQQQQAG